MRSSSCFGRAWRDYGQTILTVTHEPRVSAVADRILLLADGLIVRELGHISSGEVRSAIDALEG